MNTKLQTLIFAIMVGLVLTGCAPHTATHQESDSIVVATTFYPLFTLTQSIVGEEGTVYSIIPSGVEPHHYEPSPGDIRKLSESHVFVTLGVEFEEFEEDLVESVASHVTVIPAGEGIELIEIDEEAHNEHEEEHDEHEEEHDEHEEEHDEHEGEHDEHEEGHDDHHHTGADPHIWLSPKNAVLMSQHIMTELAKHDSKNKEAYMKNGQELIAQLQALEAEFAQGLQTCAKDTILVNHNAFEYLAKDYGFDVVSIGGLKPEVEPSPQQLAHLIDEAKEHNLKYIFYEDLVDPRVAQTIAEEVGAQVLSLSPVASDLSVSYAELMRQNLENLKTALECQ